MKKILILTILATLFTGCGVGSYSVSSGIADKAEISFVSYKPMDITVQIDGKQYSVTTVKDKKYKADRRIKKTVKNTITVEPGTREVTVMNGTETIYSHKLYISTSEHKIVEL